MHYPDMTGIGNYWCLPIWIRLQMMLRSVEIQQAKDSKPGTEGGLFHVPVQSTAYMKLPTPQQRKMFCPLWLVIVINAVTQPEQEKQQDIWEREPLVLDL